MKQLKNTLISSVIVLATAGAYSTANAKQLITNADVIEQMNQTKQQAQQDLIAEKLKATFAKTTFTNLESSIMDGLWQAEISNQVVYFNPDQELIFFGEIYDKNGLSLSEQTRLKWQAKRTAKLDVSSALVIGNGPIEIIEFTDPDCPFCQRFSEWADTKNAQYQQANNGKDLFTRKVVMTPIASLHPNAHKEAVHVLCVAKDDQTNVDTHEALSQVLKGTISYADMLDCDEGKDRLKQHESISESFGISATPTLVIDGQVIQGFNQAKLDQIVRAKLNTSQESTKQNQITGDE
ncbi:hypothetical protein BHECKSOX_2016 [Bathymodiolus heckerae thiotrophic gill symbiont]|uniref:disulfide isomerase DsbC N-terminal domain-containing protein n=1 Tax=Bathymodiolus heckerae thiotrophic gill symbiont TaxID=1052212 RepID=UPI0010BC8279|nr:disulfide isomerase DsbC N-terminal domain-containing protein [Bathymodiolus heckerae thiotrophic gill symbiont]CAC9585989.1 hypothetical protein [uncultured Gammaproteobacteria bacterium]SHN89552.1 hypothetical protein BHECKSOX_2016 [Bathymodiolus heckerae thiotrophic gill symbiont]